MNPTSALVIPIPEDLLPILVFGVVAVTWIAVVLVVDRRRKDRARLRERLGGDELESGNEERRLLSKPPAPPRASPWQVFGVPLIALVAAAAWWATGREFLGFAIFAVGYGAFTLVRRRRQQAREEAEERYALAAIETAGRVLKSGIPLPGMIDLLAKDAEGEAGGVFREIVKRGELGEDLSTSIERVLLRSGRPEIRAFGLAVMVQLEVGGNLADTTDRLVRALVDRGLIRRRSRTILAYGRLAGAILAVFPLMVIAAMSVLIDGYFDFLFDEPTGNLLLAIAAALIVVGMLSLERLARIEPRSSGVPA
ncbi:MAG: type II secretion system F family protein [Planctomycetota bacterium]|jgi:Flp pilus assembly protein TadB